MQWAQCCLLRSVCCGCALGAPEWQILSQERCSPQTHFPLCGLKLHPHPSCVALNLVGAGQPYSGGGGACAADGVCVAGNTGMTEEDVWEMIKMHEAKLANRQEYFHKILQDATAKEEVSLLVYWC